MIRLRRGLGVLAAATMLTLAAAACGSSSSSSNTNAGSSGGSNPASTQSSSTPPPASSSSGDTAWCSNAKKWRSGIAKQVEAAFAGAGTDPAKLKAAFGKLTGIYESIVNSAPGDIKPSVDVLFNAYKQVVGILQKNNFNYVKAAPQLAASQTTFNSGQVKAAEKNIQSWAKANGCS